MNDPQCLVCREPATRIAVDQLLAEKCTIREIARRVQRSKSSIARHSKHSEKTGRRGGRSKASDLSQAGQGRCKACGLVADATDPPALLRRSERLLWIAENAAARAQADDDLRLMLQAVDRANKSLETLLRAAGVIGGDTTVVVNAGQREQLSAQEAVHAIVSAIADPRLVPALLEHIAAALDGETWPKAIDVTPIEPPAEALPAADSNRDGVSGTAA